ncbi:MAG TPA: hypothetical protein VGM88_19315 [Kofleriaceae bacterium]|jgi:hypothetical protein
MSECYCEGRPVVERGARARCPVPSDASFSEPGTLRRGFALSIVLHAAAALLWLRFAPAPDDTELVDITVAPAPPPVEELPAEVARRPESPESAVPAPPAPDPSTASTLPPPPEPPPEPSVPVDAAPDAAIDAAPDAAIDAAIDARRKKPDAPPDSAIDGAPDAAPDAPIDAPPDAPIDAPPDAAVPLVAAADAAPVAPDAAVVAVGSGGSGSAGSMGSNSPAALGSGGIGSGAAAVALAASGSGMPGPAAGSAVSAGSGAPGVDDLPLVAGAEASPGTAANLLAYFPKGQVVAALIRFDRLRGTEWAATTERLLRPLPDYRQLFGDRDAHIVEPIDTLVIASPRPRDATATILVAHTHVPRAQTRELLGAAAPVAWSTAPGGQLGTRSHAMPGDTRAFLSPWDGWFLLAAPADLAPRTRPAPPWVANIRSIEAESGDKTGPAVVLTIAPGGGNVALSDDYGLGISAATMPDRISLAAELVPRGWLVRGNMVFATSDTAEIFLRDVTALRARITGSRTMQMLVGPPVAHLLSNLSFARSGARISYATSLSIADTRALLRAATEQLDHYFGRAP